MLLYLHVFLHFAVKSDSFSGAQSLMTTLLAGNYHLSGIAEMWAMIYKDTSVSQNYKKVSFKACEYLVNC